MGGYPARGVPCQGVPCLGGYPGRVQPPGQVRMGGTLLGGGTQLGQQKEYSLHGGQYASYVHAGGLSCLWVGLYVKSVLNFITFSRVLSMAQLFSVVSCGFAIYYFIYVHPNKRTGYDTSYEYISVNLGISDNLTCTAPHAFAWNDITVLDRATTSNFSKSRSPSECTSICWTLKRQDNKTALNKNIIISRNSIGFLKKVGKVLCILGPFDVGYLLFLSVSR